MGDQGTELRDSAAMHKASLEAFDVRLQADILRLSKEVDTAGHSLAYLKNTVDKLDEKLEVSLREERDRSSEEHELKMKKTSASLMASVNMVAANVDSALRDELSQMSHRNDRRHDESALQVKALLDSLDKRSSDAIAHVTVEGEKRDHEQLALGGCLEDTRVSLNTLKSELSRMSDVLELARHEVRESSTMEASRLRDEVARVLHEQAKNHEEMLQDVATRTLEHLDQQMQAEGALRLQENKEVVLALRSSLVKTQDQLEHLRDDDTRKATEELRRVVCDLAATSSGQGEKIKELEATLEKANEAKLDVHRISNDLAAEVSTRTLRDAEFSSRLERELQEVARRVDRFSSASDQLTDARASLAQHNARSSSFADLLQVGRF